MANSCCYVYLQIKNGYQFESETDTEIIPKLLKMINDTRKDDGLTFRELVERAVQQLVSYCLLVTHIIVSYFLLQPKHTLLFYICHFASAMHRCLLQLI